MTSAIGMPKASRYSLLNLWTNQASQTKNTISASVPAHAVVLYRVSVA
jgi:alpha-galactosidase